VPTLLPADEDLVEDVVLLDATPLLDVVVEVVEGLLATEDAVVLVFPTDDLVAEDLLVDALDDLVAGDASDLVEMPLLDLVTAELLEPADLETEPIPLLVVEPVVASLGV